MRGGEGQAGFILAGDVGGTKACFGLFLPGPEGPPLRTRTYASAEAGSVEDLIARFLEDCRADASACCLGVPGPVENGRCRTTNLPWVVSEEAIRDRFGWKEVSLLNDLAATAHALPVLADRDLASLNDVPVQEQGNKVLLAPGTGLGVSLIVDAGAARVVVPSEGGHADFAPLDRDSLDLWRSLEGRFGHVSVERVLSGPGLVNIYTWLRDSGRREEAPWLAREVRERENEAPALISRAALEQEDPLSAAALQFFVSLLGAAAGNLALISMARGGVYLAGGIPPKILPALRQGRFMESFVQKGRFRPVLERIGVRVILNEEAGLLGAARFASELSQSTN